MNFFSKGFVMASLSIFWLIFKLVWIERMVYRVNFFLDILSGILSSLIVVFLWIAQKVT